MTDQYDTDERGSMIPATVPPPEQQLLDVDELRAIAAEHGLPYTDEQLHAAAAAGGAYADALRRVTEPGGPRWRGTPSGPDDDPERLDLDGPGPLPEKVRLVMVEWLLHHGIRPDDVPAPCLIERQPRDHRVIVEQYLRHPTSGGRYADRTGDEAARQIVVRDLDYDVEPFPELVQQYAAGVAAQRHALRGVVDDIARRMRMIEQTQQNGIMLRLDELRSALGLHCSGRLHRETGPMQTCVLTRGHYPHAHRDARGNTWQEL